MDPLKLPIRQHADDILAAVAKHEVVVVIGETGSGKTTQLSQILLEHGYADKGIIGVTQPRRVAAVTVAKRVAEERRTAVGEEVGYAVRFEDRSCAATRIKYLTDGTLLRECLEEPLLNKYQVLILDEAHERSLNTDILFGVLKQVLAARAAAGNLLKLLVTSATLDGKKFSAYFGNCPVFTVPGRCFPVDIIHAQQDHLKDYLEAAVDTVMQIHTSQPPGDILVFLTGQAEIDKAVRRINEEVCALPQGAAGDLLALPLYASLPPELQLRVFQGGPPGARRCIVATNVAETSITVEGVVYVVDSGVVKQKHYHPTTGMESLDVVSISRVAATQRAGRAGRTRPGKCFRLYSSKYYEIDMPDVSLPEIQRTSLAGAVLQLKALKLDLDVLSFDFLDRPEQSTLEEALKQLYVLDAIDSNGRITLLGRSMAALPLDPCLGRALLAAQQLGCLPEMVTVAAMLSADHVFVAGHGPDVGNGLAPGGLGGGRVGAPAPGAAAASESARQHMQQLMREVQGDHLLLLRLYQLWAAAGYSRDFCKSYGLDLRGLNFARDIRRQLEGIMNQHSSSSSSRQEGDTAPGTQGPQQPNSSSSNGRHQPDRESHNNSDKRPDLHQRWERGQVPDAVSDRLQRSHSMNGGGSSSKAALQGVVQALTVGFATKIARRMQRHNGYRTMNEAGQLAQVHPASASLQSDEEGLLPEWLVYHELVATSRPFLRQVCPTRYEWVAPLLPKLRDVDVRKLSGAAAVAAATKQGQLAGSKHAADGEQPSAPSANKLGKKADDKSVDAAKARYLARKAQAAAAGGKPKR